MVKKPTKQLLAGSTAIRISVFDTCCCLNTLQLPKRNEEIGGTEYSKKGWRGVWRM